MLAPATVQWQFLFGLFETNFHNNSFGKRFLLQTQFWNGHSSDVSVELETKGIKTLFVYMCQIYLRLFSEVPSPKTHVLRHVIGIHILHVRIVLVVAIRSPRVCASVRWHPHPTRPGTLTEPVTPRMARGMTIVALETTLLHSCNGWRIVLCIKSVSYPQQWLQQWWQHMHDSTGRSCFQPCGVKMDNWKIQSRKSNLMKEKLQIFLDPFSLGSTCHHPAELIVFSSQDKTELKMTGVPTTVVRLWNIYGWKAL